MHPGKIFLWIFGPEQTQDLQKVFIGIPRSRQVCIDDITEQPVVPAVTICTTGSELDTGSDRPVVIDNRVGPRGDLVEGLLLVLTPVVASEVLGLNRP